MLRDAPVALQSQTGRPSAVSNILHVGGSTGASAASLCSIHRLAVRCIAEQPPPFMHLWVCPREEEGGMHHPERLESLACLTWCKGRWPSAGQAWLFSSKPYIVCKAALHTQQGEAHSHECQTWCGYRDRRRPGTASWLRAMHSFEAILKEQTSWTSRWDRTCISASTGSSSRLALEAMIFPLRTQD